MFERLTGQASRIDRRYLLRMGVIPGVATIVAMAVTFTLVGVLLLTVETVVVGSPVTRALALAVMYLLPQFAVGVWMGTRHGLAVSPAVAAGVAPVVVVVVALGLFGGPMTTPFDSPQLTLGAVVVWSVVCAAGLVVGARVVGPRYATQEPAVDGESDN